jgi:hypothetical protein
MRERCGEEAVGTAGTAAVADLKTPPIVTAFDL